MAPNRTKAVFFDVGGTLIAPNPSLAEIYSRVLTPLGVRTDTVALQRASLASWAEFDALVGSGRDRYGHFPGGEPEYWRRYVRRVLEHVGEEHLAEEATAALHVAFSDSSAWTVFPDAWDAIASLKGLGIRIGVISNWDSRLRGLLDGLGLAAQFESIVVSCEVGAEKPSAAIFEKALREMKVGSDESLHVGDERVSDYEGARAAGMEAVLIVRNGASPEGTHCVNRLDALSSLLMNGGLAGSEGAADSEATRGSEHTIETPRPGGNGR